MNIKIILILTFLITPYILSSQPPENPNPLHVEVIMLPGEAEEIAKKMDTLIKAVEEKYRLPILWEDDDQAKEACRRTANSKIEEITPR